MKHFNISVVFISLYLLSCSGNNSSQHQAAPGQSTESHVDLDQYPSVLLANQSVQMKVFLPDPEQGIYRATRFDWSGVIGSVIYQDHEYFGYWKDTQDPMVHEDLTGPVEGFLDPGLGYQEASPGGSFIRIGIGLIEKIEEPEFQWSKTYEIQDHGKWEVTHGDDWITFIHQISGDFGYAYSYEKTIRLKKDGFTIAHQLTNLGENPIHTDQFNHNFFMIDGHTSGPAFSITFPFNISTGHDTQGILDLNGNELLFLKELNDQAIFVELEGYSDRLDDHQVTVMNKNTGAGVRFSVDKPLSKLYFWACETTLSPENFIMISVDPGNEMVWTSDYTLFVER